MQIRRKRMIPLRRLHHPPLASFPSCHQTLGPWWLSALKNPTHQPQQLQGQEMVGRKTKTKPMNPPTPIWTPAPRPDLEAASLFKSRHVRPLMNYIWGKLWCQVWSLTQLDFLFAFYNRWQSWLLNTSVGYFENHVFCQMFLAVSLDLLPSAVLKKPRKVSETRTREMLAETK